MQNGKVWKCEGARWNIELQQFALISETRPGSVRCGVKSSSEWVSTEQPVRHNTGHQQSLPHTGYQHGTALGTRSVLQETSSNSASGQSERWVHGVNVTGMSPGCVPTSFWSSWREDLIRSRRAVSCFFSSSWVCLICGGKMQKVIYMKAFIAPIKSPHWQKNYISLRTTKPTSSISLVRCLLETVIW